MPKEFVINFLHLAEIEIHLSKISYENVYSPF